MARNESPVVMVYGLPKIHDAGLLAQGKTEITMGLDIANNFSEDVAGLEAIILDGETYRYDLVVRRGLSGGFEAGLDVPYVHHTGGNFDGFIESFHDFFGLPQGGRTAAPQGRLLYSYARNGLSEINLTDSVQGLGDVSFFCGYQLCSLENPASREVAVRLSLKLPTGDDDNLLGSGSTDMALSLAGSDAQSLQFFRMTWYGEVGAMLLSDGEVLGDLQRHAVGFATLGLGWQPFDSVLFKVQFDGHTPFYRDSSLTQLSTSAIQVTMGGTLAFPDHYFFEIGVVEDIILDTVPDVTFHLNFRKDF